MNAIIVNNLDHRYLCKLKTREMIMIEMKLILYITYLTIKLDVLLVN